MATIRYFAAAADAAGTASEAKDADTLGALFAALKDGRDERFADVLGRCTVLVNGQLATAPDMALDADALVDVLPPFAGG